MKKVIILGVLMYFIIIGGVCKHGYRGVLLQNNYNDSIFVITMFGLEIKYPDTTLPIKKPPISYVPPMRRWTFSNIAPSNRVKEFFDRLPSDTLSIYLFDGTTFNNMEWEVLRSDYKVLKRYDLSYDDYVKLNWTIHYPPTEVMKDMKQFPPY